MNEICAGIVLYHPDYDRLQKNVEAILPQVDQIYLVDNGSANIDNIRFTFGKREKIRLIENSENRGIAVALNQLCAAAEEDGFDWIVTLDQDSVAYDDMVEQYRAFVNEPDLAILAPNVFDDNEKGYLRSTDLPELEIVDRCNTSGCLTNLFIWRKIGGFDEDLFIDCVDFDYCTNAIKNGYRVARANKACLHHRLGQAKEVNFFLRLGRFLHADKLKRTVYTYNHSPLRTYYYARNIRYYMHKYKDFIDIKKERKVYFRWLVLKLCFEKQRFRKLCAIIKGRRDAVKMIRAYDHKNKQA